MARLARCRQGKLESIQNYTDRFKKDATLAGRTEDRALLYQYLEGMHNHLKLEVLRQGIARMPDINSICQFLKTWECAITGGSWEDNMISSRPSFYGGGGVHRAYLALGAGVTIRPGTTLTGSALGMTLIGALAASLVPAQKGSLVRLRRVHRQAGPPRPSPDTVVPPHQQSVTYGRNNIQAKDSSGQTSMDTSVHDLAQQLERLKLQLMQSEYARSNNIMHHHQPSSFNVMDSHVVSSMDTKNANNVSVYSKFQKLLADFELFQQHFESVKDDRKDPTDEAKKFKEPAAPSDQLIMMDHPPLLDSMRYDDYDEELKNM
jgi:hypothetical protein